MKGNRTKWWIKGLIALFSLLLVFSVAPYLFPITTATSERTAPFPESVFMEIDGIILHYRMWKTDDTNHKGKILLVHGLGGSTFSWRNNVDDLSRAGYIVLAVDLPGFGYSDRKRGIDHSQENRSLLLWQMLERVDQTLETQMQDGLWILAGHSMGGGTVTAMALAKPERTRTVVLVDGAVLAGGTSLGFLMYYPPAKRCIEALGRNLFFKKDRIAGFLASAYGTVPSDAEVEGYLEPFQLDGTEGSFADMIRTSTLIDENALKKLAVPVIAIWGEKDLWVPLEEADKLQAVLPSMSMEMIAGAAHCPMETHSSVFNPYLIEVLDRIAE